MTDASSPLTERLGRLAAWADRFAAPGFSFGSWVDSRTDDDGVIHMPWFERSDDGQRFVSEMYELGWIREFDWMAWLATPDGHGLSRAPDAIAAATADELANVLTAIIRGERFSDGQLEGAFESGILPAIARRAGELLADEGRRARTTGIRGARDVSASPAQPTSKRRTKSPPGWSS